jgi:hyperosmotically inducible periplasmic protein
MTSVLRAAASRFLLATCTVAVATHGPSIGAAKGSKSVETEIRDELLQLPYYGVFDFLAFKYERGTVTLLGYAYQPSLKRDAERAVRRVEGVEAVTDEVEALPASSFDDQLRWRTYYAIYRDPFLSRYAPGGGLLWGHRHAFARGFLSAGPFPGSEPAGDYPIHIIVRNGRIRLVGVVDSESDKNIAGVRAREVPESFGVENDLMVERNGSGTR